MQCSITEALGTLTVLLASIRAVSQVIRFTRLHKDKPATIAGGRLIDLAPNVAAISYAHAIGADSILLTSAWITLGTAISIWMAHITGRMTVRARTAINKIALTEASDA